MIGEVLFCMVVGISDGDTLQARCAQQTLKVRLAEIDAPEKTQPFGFRSKTHLSDLCFKAQAEIRPQKIDRYGRTVARVRCNGVDASSEQTHAGMAWAYRKYLTDQNLLLVEADAKTAKRGLWVDAAPVPPWEWRRSTHGAVKRSQTGE